MMGPERLVHYTLGHTELDRQHCEMFILMDQIILHLRAKEFTEAETHIDTLHDFIITHNEYEYSLMKDSAFPYIDYHQSHNFSIAAAVLKLREHTGREHITHFEISSFEETFTNHIDHSDRQFVDHMKAKGII